MWVQVTESPWASAFSVKNGHENYLQIGSEDKMRCNGLMEMLSKVGCHANITNDKQCSLCGCASSLLAETLGEQERERGRERLIN